MKKSKPFKLVVFHLEEQKFAIHLSNVEQVTHSVQIKSLSISPHYIAGTVNIQGEILPVISVRGFLNFPMREIELTDHFIVVKSTNMRMVLWVDSADDIVTISEEEIEESRNNIVDSSYVEGIFKLRNGIVMINDLNKFLTHEQMSRLSLELVKQISGNN